MWVGVPVFAFGSLSLYFPFLNQIVDAPFLLPQVIPRTMLSSTMAISLGSTHSLFNVSVKIGSFSSWLNRIEEKYLRNSFSSSFFSLDAGGSFSPIAETIASLYFECRCSSTAFVSGKKLSISLSYRVLP